MEQQTKEIVDFFLDKKILLSPDILDGLKPENLSQHHKIISEKINTTEFLILNKDINELLSKLPKIDISWLDLEKSKALLEKGLDEKLYDKFLAYLTAEQKKQETPEQSPVKVVFSYDLPSKKREIQDFVQFFNSRYNDMEAILRQRQELQGLNTIVRILNKREKENVSLIAIVSEKHTTKNGNIILKVEDPTGAINVLINKNKPDLFNQANDIVLDEIIGIVGVNGDNIVFANNLLWPDIPMTKELKKYGEEIYSIFLSDLHIGSKNFLEEDFNRFLSWLRCEIGTEQQKKIASKVRFLFIVGDLVDGCGIYPGQDEELNIKDIYKQYEECARLLKRIPSHIRIIICPGNHDAMRIAEPQPPLYEDFSGALYDLPNVTLVSNPAVVNVCQSGNFSGFDVLLYHGYSFDYFVANVASIRNSGGYDRADMIMKFLLKRRHLAPTHTSTLYLPDSDQDPLVIRKIPDFFVTGHVHKSIAAHYRNITLICGSCWQSKTSFQEKVGHHPQPSRVPIVNLKTREVKILRFGE